MKNMKNITDEIATTLDYVISFTNGYLYGDDDFNDKECTLHHPDGTINTKGLLIHLLECTYFGMEDELHDRGWDESGWEENSSPSEIKNNNDLLRQCKILRTVAEKLKNWKD